MKTVRRGRWLAPAVVCLAGIPAVAQQPAPGGKAAETVRVHVINVDVFVAGSNGAPVFGLGPEQFELREDGRPVALTNFLPPGLPNAAKVANAPPAPPITGEIAPLSDEDERQQTLVVFVDDLNLTRLTRSLVFERLGSVLDGQLRHGYRVAVLAFGLSLHHYTPLTSDRGVVAAGVERLRRELNEGAASRSELLADRVRGAGYDPGQMGGSANQGRGAAVASGQMGGVARQGLDDEATAVAQEQYVLQLRLLKALLGVVDSFAGVPGRKALLFISEGIPVTPGAGVLGGGVAGGGLAQGVRWELRDVARHANAGRITFYTLSVPPPGGSMTAEARNSTFSEGSVIDAFNREQSLTEFTTATGGRKLFNPNSLAKMAADLETTYSLGYSPSHFGDGKYHRLSVKVNHPGVSVRFREGYLDKTLEQRQADRTTAALLAGGNTNPLGAHLVLGQPVAHGRKELLVPLTVTIPAASLLLLRADGSEEGKVSITVAVAKSDGSTSQTHRETFPIKVPAAAVVGFLKQNTTFTFSLLVQSGDTSVSVTARDEVGQVESVVVTDLVPSGGRI